MSFVQNKIESTLNVEESDVAAGMCAQRNVNTNGCSSGNTSGTFTQYMRLAAKRAAKLKV